MLKLHSRTLMIVTFPLLCQLVFVCVLVCLLLNMQDRAIREGHNRDILNSAYNFTTETCQSLFQGLIKGDTSKINPEHSKLLNDRLKKLFESDNSDIRQKQVYAKLQEVAQTSGSAVRTWQNGKDAYGHFDSDQLDKLLRTGGAALSSLIDAIIQLDADEQKETARELEALRKLRSDVLFTFVSMLSASVLGAIALGLYYANSIKAPLERLTINSRLLSERKPLLAPLTSQDELAEVDRLMHIAYKSIEEALNREQEMLDNAADMLWSLDEDGRILSVNPITEKIIGLSADSIVGLSWLKFLFSEDRARAEGCVSKACESEGKEEFELRLINAEGQLINTRWTVLWSVSQSVLFCIVRDISEEIRLANLKQNYINMVTDDLRNPLREIQHSMTAIASGSKGPVSAAVLKEVAETESTIGLLGDLINDLLDLQKLQSGKMALSMSEFSVQDILHQSRDLVLATAQAKRIEIVIPDTNLKIVADANKIRQCLVNLLSNAIEFSPINSAIEIEATGSTDTLELSVKDCGPGVPEQFREKIFDAFEQVPSSGGGRRGGTGLGLAICRLIAEAHGGQTGVRPKENATGSVFWLAVPIKGYQMSITRPAKQKLLSPKWQ